MDMNKASNARKPTPESRAIAAQVRAEQGAARITKEEMIRRSGISRTAYYAIESGERPMDVSQLAAICKVLGISIAELVTRAMKRIGDEGVTLRDAR